MPINAGLMSSATPEWATPRDLFEKLDRAFGPLVLDVCATAKNTKCPMYIGQEQDGLKTPWPAARLWMNPPYGRAIGEWVDKASLAARKGSTVVCLLPARTDTQWWQRNVEICDLENGRMVRRSWVREVLYLEGRVKFNGAGPAPFPSAVVVFGPPGNLDGGA